MKNIIEWSSELLDNMIINIQAMGYSAYVVLAAILILLLFMLILRRFKLLTWLLLTVTAALCMFMLYYVLSGIQILLFIKINNLLSNIQNIILKASGGVILGIVVFSGLLSMIIGKKRSRRSTRGGDYDGYDYGYDDDGDDGDD
jgi:hypothetical protein